MDFQAVIESLDKNRPVNEENNPYNALFPPTLARKPTLTNLVQQLKQQSSKTRFVKQYKKLSTNTDIELPIKDDVDFVRKDTGDEQQVIEELVISQKKQEKRPMKRRVYINESANQMKSASILTNKEDVIFEEPIGDMTMNRFIRMDKAIDILRNDIEQLNNEIEKEIENIHKSQKEIMKYKQGFLCMQTQFDSIQYSLQNNNLQEMKQQSERIQENELNHSSQKYRFDKYRKGMSIETRLFELDKKIKAAYRRDEIWAGIRDWGSFISKVIKITCYY